MIRDIAEQEVHLAMASMRGSRPQGSGVLIKLEISVLDRPFSWRSRRAKRSFFRFPGTPPAASSTIGDTGLPSAQKSKRPHSSGEKLVHSTAQRPVKHGNCGSQQPKYAIQDCKKHVGLSQGCGESPLGPH